MRRAGYLTESSPLPREYWDLSVGVHTTQQPHLATSPPQAKTGWTPVYAHSMAEVVKDAQRIITLEFAVRKDDYSHKSLYDVIR